jgi:hypothetical protein
MNDITIAFDLTEEEEIFAVEDSDEALEAIASPMQGITITFSLDFLYSRFC